MKIQAKELNINDEFTYQPRQRKYRTVRKIIKNSTHEMLKGKVLIILDGCRQLELDETHEVEIKEEYSKVNNDSIRIKIDPQGTLIRWKELLEKMKALPPQSIIKTSTENQAFLDENDQLMNGSLIAFLPIFFPDMKLKYSKMELSDGEHIEIIPDHFLFQIKEYVCLYFGISSQWYKVLFENHLDIFDDEDYDFQANVIRKWEMFIHAIEKGFVDDASSEYVYRITFERHLDFCIYAYQPYPKQGEEIVHQFLENGADLPL